MEGFGWPQSIDNTVNERHQYGRKILTNGIESCKKLVGFSRRIVVASTALSLELSVHGKGGASFSVEEILQPGETTANSWRFLFSVNDRLSGFHSELAKKLITQVCNPLRDIIMLMEGELAALDEESINDKISVMKDKIATRRQACDVALTTVKSFVPYKGTSPIAKIRREEEFGRRLKVVEECYRNYEAIVSSCNATVASFMENVQDPRLRAIEEVELCRQQMISDISNRLEVMGHMLPNTI
uniref:Uncharacterized protein n=1 Tax=Spongospora subterranea TaxID=70186 RepID=A0A0H5R9P8_9EUKA|eukprot:CRZ10855.1 hypothetical protein [Spongospora subterranea]